MRQCLAISYVFLFFYFYIKKRKLLSVFFMVIALSFHLSSIFALLFLLPFKNSRRTAILFFQVLSLIGGLLIYSFIAEYSSDMMLYGSYLADTDKAFRSDVFFAFIYVVLLNVFSATVVILLPVKGLQSMWTKLFFFSIYVMNLLFSLHYGARIYNIFSMSQILVFSNIISNNQFNVSNSLKLIIWVYIIVLFIKMLVTNSNGILPYNFIFS